MLYIHCLKSVFRSKLNNLSCSEFVVNVKNREQIIDPRPLKNNRMSRRADYNVKVAQLAQDFVIALWGVVLCFRVGDAFLSYVFQGHHCIPVNTVHR